MSFSMLKSFISKSLKLKKNLPIRSFQTSRIDLRKLGSELGSSFTIEGLKKNYEVLPLVFIVGGVIIAVLSFTCYSLMTRTDVRFYRINNGTTLAERMDLNNPPYLKLMNTRKAEEISIPELAKLLEEINNNEKK